MRPKLSLLRDIQNAASSQDNRVSDLLRKCKILASRLQSKELDQWVERELNGYKDEDELPVYRITTDFDIRGDFNGPFGSSIKNAQISLAHLPDFMQRYFVRIMLRQSVAVLEDLISQDDRGYFHNLIPQEVVQQFARNVYINYSCLEAYQRIPRGAFVNILDAVRNRIMGFVLDIEKENPQAGEADVNTTPVPEPKVSQVFNNHFHGSSGNVAIGSQSFEQNATVNQQWQEASQSLNLTRLAVELPQLREALTRAATEPEQYLALSAVRSAEKEVEKKDAPKVLEYLAKAGQWALDAAKETGSTVAADAIKKALGLSSP